MAYEESELAIYDHGPWPEEPEAYRELVQEWSQSDKVLAVIQKSTKLLAGFITLSKRKDGDYELGYNFHPDARGKGLATEACSAVLAHVFKESDINRVTAGTAKANTRSKKLLKKLGFVFLKETVTSFRKDEIGKPIRFIGLDFELTRERWQYHCASQNGKNAPTS
jgi:RimJ/RimL family protein N-acetyltransferase